MNYLEGLLTSHGIGYGASQDFDLGAKPINDNSDSHSTNNNLVEASKDGHDSPSKFDLERERNDSEKLEKLVSNIGMVSVQGTSDPRFLGSTSGISFARVVFAAVRSAVPSGVSRRKSSDRSKNASRSTFTKAPSMRGTCYAECE